MYAPPIPSPSQLGARPLCAIARVHAFPVPSLFTTLFVRYLLRLLDLLYYAYTKHIGVFVDTKFRQHKFDRTFGYEI